MGYFPLFMDISNKTVFIVGDTPAAKEKRQRLEPFGPMLRLFPAGLTEADLEESPVFVVAALADRDENRRISALCRRQRIPVNVVDDPELCTFYFPALITRGDLTVGISTSGKSPAAAVILKQQMQALIPADMDAILDWAQALRQQLSVELPDFQTRAAFLRQTLSESIQLGRPLSEQEVDKLRGKEVSGR